MKGEYAMTEKIVVMHDASVYKALQKQIKFNRKVTMFSIVLTAYLITKEIQIRNMEDELDRLIDEKGE